MSMMHLSFFNPLAFTPPPPFSTNHKKGARAVAAAGKRAKGAIGMTSDDERESVASDVSFLSEPVELPPSRAPTPTPGDIDASAGSGSGTGAGGGAGDFAGTMEKIQEKRTSTREDGLKELTAGLRSYAYADAALANRETIFSTLLTLLRRAGEREGVLCAEALGLMLLLLGPEEDEIYRQVRPPLEFAVTRGQYEEVRVEAARTLAMGSFICNSEEEATLDNLQFFEALFSGESEGEFATDDLKAAAVDAWALLATVAPTGYHTYELRIKLLEEFLALLDASSAELKVAAGEALALLREYWRGVLGPSPQTSAEEEDLMDSIVDRLQDMAREGSKRMSRKDKKAQRASFREVYAAVVEGQPPEEVLNFRTRSFRLTSWVKMKQLEALRDCLQGGFLVGFARNAVIHDIFDIDPSSFETPAERAVVDKNSNLGKWRTNLRDRNRRSRESAKHYFTEDQEDG